VAKDVLQELPSEYLGIDPQTTSAKVRPATQTQPVKRSTQTSARTQSENMASTSQP
jgi:hypothetical protein